MNDEQKAIFRIQATIPEGASLKIGSFGTFYDRRKGLLTERIRKLLG